MKIIGLTGGIASGKSTVAGILRELGAAVIDADALAREVVAPGMPAHAAIVHYFGPSILAPDGTLDRKKLGERVFADPEARRRLEQITHPEIRRLGDTYIELLRTGGAPMVFYMAPLLLEAGRRDSVDEIWVVHVAPEIQLARLMARDGLSREDALRRIASQMPLEEKAQYGRFVIDNSGRPEDTAAEVKKLWQESLREAGN